MHITQLMLFLYVRKLINLYVGHIFCFLVVMYDRLGILVQHCCNDYAYCSGLFQSA